MYDKYRGVSTRCPQCMRKLRLPTPEAYPVHKPLTSIIRSIADAKQSGFDASPFHISKQQLQRKDVLGSGKHGTVHAGVRYCTVQNTSCSTHVNYSFARSPTCHWQVTFIHSRRACHCIAANSIIGNVQ